MNKHLVASRLRYVAKCILAAAPNTTYAIPNNQDLFFNSADDESDPDILKELNKTSPVTSKMLKVMDSSMKRAGFTVSEANYKERQIQGKERIYTDEAGVTVKVAHFPICEDGGDIITSISIEDKKMVLIDLSKAYAVSGKGQRFPLSVLKDYQNKLSALYQAVSKVVEEYVADVYDNKAISPKQEENQTYSLSYNWDEGRKNFSI